MTPTSNGESKPPRPGEDTEDDSRAAAPHAAGRALREAGLRARKSLGQNFLTDRTVPPRIVAAAHIEPGDTVIEVGPGLGVLTEEITANLDPEMGRLVAVELDSNLVPLLRERFAAHKNVQIVQADVLETAPQDLVGEQPYKVVANLPYYITSAVLRHFLEAVHKPVSLTVMVQREVGERMSASPPDMSLLAVAVQFYGRPKVAFRVPPGAFHPVPKVESAVVHIPLRPPSERPVPPAQEAAFFRLARAGFSQKRKQLANTISTDLGLPKQQVLERLSAEGIVHTRRAETLSLEEWARVQRAFESLLSGPESRLGV